MMVPIPTMLSFTFRRVLSHPGIFSIAQRLPTRAISSNQSFATTVQRNLTTTASDPNSDSGADSESKPKSTRRKTGSTPKLVGTVGKGEGKPVTKPKVAVEPEIALKPRMPANAYIQWLRDWIATQPQPIELYRDTVKRAGPIWKSLPEYEKLQYQERNNAQMDEYRRRIAEWREKVDPVALQELNRIRVAEGRHRIRGPRRPRSGFNRFFSHVYGEYPKAGEDQQSRKSRFKATAERAASQWRAMSDAEKAEYNDPAKAELAVWREKFGASQAKAKV